MLMLNNTAAKPGKIRNFTIIAHVDHGKTTLVDKILEFANVKTLNYGARITDRLPVEQQRGITVKMQPVSIKYRGFMLNLIDTPGHIDFAYEVSRSLKAVEGAVLLIDATQGIQAQTIENLLKALEADLKIIPALSKVDAVSQELLALREQQIQKILGFSKEQIIHTSGKTGQGIEELLDRIVQDIPAPKSLQNKNQDTSPPQALIFDLHYNKHLGMIATVRVFSGTLKAGDNLVIVNTKHEFNVKQVGIFTPEQTPTKELASGMIGYIATGIKQTKILNIGQTIGNQQTPVIQGYTPPKPMIYASIFAQDSKQYTQFKNAMEQLRLNDSALYVQEIRSSFLGRGYKLGALGTLHLEIVRERIKQEFNVDTIITMPSVGYKVLTKTNKEYIITAPTEWTQALQTQAKTILEPILHAEVITKDKSMSAVSEIIKQFRGEILDIHQTASRGVSIDYYRLQVHLPLAALIEGFFSKLMQVSKGYASFSYNKITYAPTQMVRVDILINKTLYPELSFLSHPDTARPKAVKILQALKSTINRSVIAIPLQAAIGGKIIARETIPAYRKNVTAKLYGGDVTRKLKLLKKQAKQKAARKEHIKIKIPPDTFIKAIKMVNF